jgi:hypothetical protein
MDWVLVAAGVVALIAVMVALATFMRFGALRDELAALCEARERDRATAARAIRAAEKHLADRAEAVERLAEMKNERDAAMGQIEALRAMREAASHEADLARQTAAEAEKRLAYREAARPQPLTHARPVGDLTIAQTQDDQPEPPLQSAMGRPPHAS